MNRLWEKWLRIWFVPAAPTNLAICRILIFALFLIRYLVLPLSASSYPEMSAAFYKPFPLLGHLTLPILPSIWLRILEAVWLGSLALSSIGFLTRLSTTLSFTLGFYLIYLPHNFGKLHHTDMVTVLVLGIMMLSRCGDALSLDRLIQKNRFKTPPPEIPTRSGEYTWPIRVVWLVLAGIFFAAGISKLRHSGLEWVFSDNLALMLIKRNYLAYIDYPPLLPWGLTLGRYVWVCQILAGLTLFFETAYPLALVSRRARRILAPGMFLVIFGSTLIFLPSFVELLSVHVFWVPWDKLGQQIKRRVKFGKGSTFT